MKKGLSVFGAALMIGASSATLALAQNYSDGSPTSATPITQPIIHGPVVINDYNGFMFANGSNPVSWLSIVPPQFGGTGSNVLATARFNLGVPGIVYSLSQLQNLSTSGMTIGTAGPDLGAPPVTVGTSVLMAPPNGGPLVKYMLYNGTSTINDGGGEVNSFATPGTYWHLIPPSIIDVRTWPTVVPDAVLSGGQWNGSNNQAGIQAAVNYVAQLNTKGDKSSPILTLAGQDYCVYSPIEISAPYGLNFGDGTGTLHACGGATWNSGAAWTPSSSLTYPPDPFPQPSGTSVSNPNEPVGIVDIPGLNLPSPDLSTNVIVNLNIDGNNQTNVAGFTNHYNGTGITFSGTISAWQSWGLFTSGTVRTSTNGTCTFSQSFARSGRIGVAIGVAKGNDNIFQNCVVSYSMLNYWVDGSSSDTAIKDGHFFAGATAGAGGDPTYNPVNAYIASSTLITGNTIDNGAILIPLKTGPTIPQVQITDNLFEYTLDNGASWAMPAYIRLVNSIGPTGSDPTLFAQNGKIIVKGNAFPPGTSSAGLPILTISLEGSSTWYGAAKEWAAALNMGTEMGGFKVPTGPISSSTTFYTYPANGQMAACDVSNTITQAGNAVTLTLPADAPVGCTAEEGIEGTGTVTFAPATGASVVGTTSTGTKGRYTAYVFRNSGFNAAEWSVK